MMMSLSQVCQQQRAEQARALSPATVASDAAAVAKSVETATAPRTSSDSSSSGWMKWLVLLAFVGVGVVILKGAMVANGGDMRTERDHA